MADITKCIYGCDKKESCRRWTAPDSHWQAVQDFTPNENGECVHYYPNRNESN